MARINYSYIGQGQTYTTPQGWETGTRSNLVYNQVVEVGIIVTTGNFTNLTISGSTTNQDYYRMLMADSGAYYNLDSRSGAYFSSINIYENYFRLGPGILINRTGSVGTALNISGQGYIVNGLAIANLGNGATGIRSQGQTGYVINSIIYGDLSGGVAITSDNSGTIGINNSIYSHSGGIGSRNTCQINSIITCDNITGFAAITGSRSGFYSLLTYTGISSSNLSGQDPYYIFDQTARLSENFNLANYDNNLAFDYGFNTEQINNDLYGIIPYDVYSGLKYSTVGQAVISALRKDFSGSERQLYQPYDAGAVNKKVYSNALLSQEADLNWYLSEYQPDTYSGRAGGILTTSILNEGPLDLFEKIETSNQKTYVIPYGTALPALYISGSSSGGYATFKRSDNNQDFYFRAWNYVDELAPYVNTILGVSGYYPDAMGTGYNRARKQADFAEMRENGFNAIRYYIQAGEYGEPDGSSINGGIIYTGLWPTYLERLSTMIEDAYNENLYFLIRAEVLPLNVAYYTTYYQPSSASILDQISLTNQAFLYDGYKNSKKIYLSGLCNYLYDSLGEDIYKTILWSVQNEDTFYSDAHPFTSGDQATGLFVTTGVFPNPNHGSGYWNMSSAADRSNMTFLTYRRNVSEYVSTIKSVYSGSLVCATIMEPGVGDRTGWDNITYYPNKRPYHTVFMDHLTGASLDFYGLNLYHQSFVRGGESGWQLNLGQRTTKEILDTIGWNRSQAESNPFAITEFGYFSGYYNTDWNLAFERTIGAINAGIGAAGIDNMFYWQWSGSVHQTNALFGTYPEDRIRHWTWRDHNDKIKPITSPSYRQNLHTYYNNGESCYRKIYLRNDAIGTAYNTRIYLRDAEYINDFAMAPAKSTGDYVDQSYRMPREYAYSDFTGISSRTGSLYVGTLASGDYVGFWVRLNISGNYNDDQAGVKLLVNYNDQP